MKEILTNATIFRAIEQGFGIEGATDNIEVDRGDSVHFANVLYKDTLRTTRFVRIEFMLKSKGWEVIGIDGKISLKAINSINDFIKAFTK